MLSVTECSNCIWQPAEAPPETRSQRIRTIAFQAFTELIASLSLAAFLTVNFVPTLSFFFTAVLIQTAFNTSLRLARGYCSLKGREGWANRFSWLEAWGFTRAIGVHGQTFLHESGHAIAAHAIFNQANPKICFNPSITVGSAHTSFRNGELSWFGKTLGRKKALAFLSFAGPAMTLSISAGFLIWGLKNQKTHPQLSRYFITAAISDFLFHALYAIDALFCPSKNLSHDFVRLFSVGIHPVAASIAILAIPIFIFIGHIYS